MPWWRRAYYYWAVRRFGENAMLGRYRSKLREYARRVCAPGVCKFR